MFINKMIDELIHWHIFFSCWFFCSFGRLFCVRACLCANCLRISTILAVHCHMGPCICSELCRLQRDLVRPLPSVPLCVLEIARYPSRSDASAASSPRYSARLPTALPQCCKKHNVCWKSSYSHCQFCWLIFHSLRETDPLCSWDAIAHLF